MTLFPNALLALAHLAVFTIAVPLPQAGSSSSCDIACLEITQAALSCQNEPAASALSCLCSVPSFVTAAQLCIACGGGNVFPGGEGLTSIAVGVDACGDLPAGLIGVLVTEAPTVPITISAWAPEGFSPSLTYLIEETGGANTTIENIRTTTVTRTTATFTATVTDEFILGPTAVVEYTGNDGFDDIIYCALEDGSVGTTAAAGAGSGQVAECVQFEFDGTSLTLQETFTLTGATSSWVAYPAPTAPTGTIGV